MTDHLARISHKGIREAAERTVKLRQQQAAPRAGEGRKAPPPVPQTHHSQIAWMQADSELLLRAAAQAEMHAAHAKANEAHARGEDVSHPLCGSARRR